MNRFFAIAPVLFASLTAAPASAQFKTPEATVESLYALYRASDSTGFNDKQAARFLDPVLARQYRSAKHIDADFFVQGQDFELTDLVIGKPDVNGDKATLTVTFKNFRKPSRLAYSLVRANDGWRISDARSGKDTLRGMLKAASKP